MELVLGPPGRSFAQGEGLGFGVSGLGLRVSGLGFLLVYRVFRVYGVRKTLSLRQLMCKKTVGLKVAWS